MRSLRVVLSVVASVVLVGCASAQAADPEADARAEVDAPEGAEADGNTEADATPPEPGISMRSGERIRWYVWEGEDGSRWPDAGGVAFDSLLDIDCRWQVATDWQSRCLPSDAPMLDLVHKYAATPCSPANRVFSRAKDAGCEGREPPPMVTVTSDVPELDLCGGNLRPRVVYEVGEAVELSEYYDLSCELRELDEPETFYRVGPEVPPETFVAAERKLAE